MSDQKTPYNLSDDEPAPDSNPTPPETDSAPDRDADPDADRERDQAPSSDAPPYEPEPPPPPSTSPIGRVTTIGKIAAPPVLDAPDELPCPRCGTPIKGEDVICVGCGYDLGRGVALKPQTGVDEIELREPLPPIVVATKPSAKTLFIIGVVVSVAAIVASGVNAPVQTFAIVASSLVLTAYTIAIHSGTGLLAVALTARLEERRIGDTEQAAARMFVCLAVFTLCTTINAPIKYVGEILMFIVGGLAYWGLLLLLLRQPRYTTLMIMAAHGILWLIVELGMELASRQASWIQQATPANTIVP